MITLGVSAQNVTVKGTIKDNLGDEVIGATVVEKGKPTNGSTTNISGQYQVSVPKNATLVISYVGMKTKEVKVNGQTTINVTLEDDSKLLDEVVAIGYGSVRKKDITGAVATVNSEVLEAVPVASALEALSGKMAGVQIKTTEGSPDAQINVRVRGGGSITGDNSPLYIVDGFPMESITDIPASEIEDMTVLKDAASTAIYGSRGAYGVILVTTKNAKEGKVNVTYNAYVSAKKMAKKMDVLNASDYAKWQWELALLKNSGKVGSTSSYTDYFGNYQDIDLFDGQPTNDWQDLTFGRTGITTNHNVNISGGSDKIKYVFGYAYLWDKAIMEGSNFRRHNISLKLNTKPAKNFDIDYSIRFSDTKVKGGGTNDATTTLDTDKRLKYSVIYTPIPLENLDPSAGTDQELGNLFNPIESIYDNDKQKKQTNVTMSGAATWEIFKNFKLKGELGYDIYKNKVQTFFGPTTYYVRNTLGSSNPAIRLADTNRNRFRSTNTISYDFKDIINKNHHLNAVAGHEYIITQKSTLTAINYDFPSSVTADQAWQMTKLGKALSTDDYYDPDDKLLSFFGRVNYDYQSKYLLSATFRADASSKFAKVNRWGYFPSAAAAWRISAEPFMEGASNWLSDLKLRFSYGTAGNNNIPSGQIVQEYGGNATTWINGVNTYWAPSKVMANPNLKWETTITRNIGIDYSILGGKLNGSFEFYLNSTKDLLMSKLTPGTGYESQYVNMGENQNKGVEFTLNYDIVNKKKWGINMNFNIGLNRNKVVSLGTYDEINSETYWCSTDIGPDYLVRVGDPIGQMYGYVADGRYETTDFVNYDETTNTFVLKEGVASDQGVIGTKVRPGSMKLKDLNDDGIVDSKDKTVIGNANPDFTGGFAINARFYGFDLSANFNYSVGNDIYNANKMEFTTTTHDYSYRNLLTSMESGKRWTNLNADGTLCNDLEQLAVLNANTSEFSPYTSKGVFSSYCVEDGSFLRLQTLTLGYTFPKSCLSKAGISNLRIYATGSNLFCWTKYSGYDPEVDCIRRTNLTPGVDYSAYPKSRSILVGLNLSFGATNNSRPNAPVEARVIEKEVIKEVPVVKEVIKEVPGKSTTVQNTYVVTFEQNSSEIKNNAELNGIPSGSSVEIVAYASPEGNADANVALSQRRADAVAEYLKSKGINVVRISAKGADTQHANRIAIVTVK